MLSAGLTNLDGNNENIMVDLATQNITFIDFIAFMGFIAAIALVAFIAFLVFLAFSLSGRSASNHSRMLFRLIAVDTAQVTVACASVSYSILFVYPWVNAKSLFFQ